MLVIRNITFALSECRGRVSHRYVSKCSLACEGSPTRTVHSNLKRLDPALFQNGTEVGYEITSQRPVIITQLDENRS